MYADDVVIHLKSGAAWLEKSHLTLHVKKTSFVFLLGLDHEHKMRS